MWPISASLTEGSFISVPSSKVIALSSEKAPHTKHPVTQPKQSKRCMPQAEEAFEDICGMLKLILQLKVRVIARLRGLRRLSCESLVM
eukprot:4349605-Amphidinium_carterae.1